MVYKFHAEILPSTQTSAGDYVKVQITPYDGFINGTAQNSSEMIIQDVAQVTQVGITPEFPLYSEDLNCSFTIVSELPANLSANITWYNGTDPAMNLTMNVTNGTNWTSLGSGNTTAGEIWMCYVRPIHNTTGEGQAKVNYWMYRSSRWVFN